MFFNFFLVLPVNELIFQWTISGSICVVLITCELKNWNLFSNDGCWPHLIRRKRGHVFCAYSRHISQRLQAPDRSSHLSKYEGGGKEEEGDISVSAPFICCIPQNIRLFSKQKALFGVLWNSAPPVAVFTLLVSFSNLLTGLSQSGWRETWHCLRKALVVFLLIF